MGTDKNINALSHIQKGSPLNTLFVILHVLAAVLFLGPVTVAVSTFHVRAYDAHKGNDAAKGIAKGLFRISQSYGLLSLLVPLLGLGLMFTGDYWSQGKFHASITLSAIAWALLFFVILPRQRKMAAALGIGEADDKTPAEDLNWAKAKSQLSMFGGIFNLLWVVVLILMLI